MADGRQYITLTGIKPTGEPHLGNYAGAIKPSLELASRPEARAYLFIADYHSLTFLSDPKELRRLTQSAAAAWLACGLDPEKSVFYLQSDVPELFELSWILSCLTPKGLMNRAHSYKAKKDQNRAAGQKDEDKGVNMGLYSYPALMAADILLFSANKVPVGEDQVQHLEMARDIAQKFNHVYKESPLTVPEAAVQKGRTVLGLDGRKMSKSYQNHIPLFSEEKRLRKLVMRIKTDSSDPAEPKDPKSCLIFGLYRHFASEKELAAMERRYAEGIGWGGAKEILFEKLRDFFKERKKIYDHYMENPADLNGILKKGGERARAAARPFLRKIRKAIGLFP